MYVVFFVITHYIYTIEVHGIIVTCIEFKHSCVPNENFESTKSRAIFLVVQPTFLVAIPKLQIKLIVHM